MKSIKLNLPEDLLERIDEARGDVSRLVWIRRACEQRLYRGPHDPETVPEKHMKFLAPATLTEGDIRRSREIAASAPIPC